MGNDDGADTPGRGGGRLRVPEEGEAAAVADVEEEVLAHPLRQIDGEHQRQAEEPAVEVDGPLHVGADEREVVHPSQLELGFRVVIVGPPRRGGLAASRR